MIPARHGELVQRALDALGIDNLVLAIHDAAFPGEPGEDAGHGTPTSRGGERLLRFARALGFNGVQLGPAGRTSESNASPYDATAFSRDLLSISLGELASAEPFAALLREDDLAAVAAAAPASPDRTAHRAAYRAHLHALRAAYLRLAAGEAPALAARVRRFAAENAAWIEPEALYDALCEEHGEPWFRAWTRDGAPHPDQDLWAAQTPREDRVRELLARHRDRVEEFAFYQLLAHEQHAALRGRAAGIGLALYGDLQIGMSAHDAWAYRGRFLRGYVMGAPPSRTNPEGQPWGYPVLDPDQVQGAGAAKRLLAARMDKMFAEFDGVRIDHPHGLVCPWVYRADDPDPGAAVRAGARLFSSPDLPDHPALARYAIVPPAQIREEARRYADDRVRDLSEQQVDRYGALFDAVVAAARRNGRPVSRIVCEVLSTMPLPLARVLARYGLGRFRVAQKASLDDPSDVYRMEHARTEDWVMLGTHDTLPAFRVAAGWAAGPLGPRWAAHLASRLAPRDDVRAPIAAAITAGGAGALVHALFADLCASRARNVIVSFGDLFGLLDPYNTPGTIGDHNWSIRLPPDFDRRYEAKLARGEALDLPRALAAAVRARGAGADLAAALDQLSTDLRGAGAPAA